MPIDVYCKCGCGQITGIAKSNDPRYGHVKGQHFTYRAGHQKGKRPDTLDGVLAACNKDANGCLNWTRSLDRKGYGQYVRFDGTKTGVHRFVYEEFNGVRLNRETLVRHKCDNPKCCNPEHLETGTHYDNNHDAKSRGRSAIGEKHGMAKITESDVVRILSSDEPDRELADRYSVGVPQIRNIRSRSSWKHVQDYRPESVRLRFGHKKTKAIEWMGQTYSLRQLSSKTGVSLTTLTRRLRNGWPVEDAVIPPQNKLKDVHHEPKA